MATFQVGSVTVSFGAMIQHNDNAGPVRVLECGAHFRTQADWNTMRTLLNPNMEVVPIPWGNTVEIVIKSGPGQGTLTIPGLTPSVYTAAFLSAAERDTWCAFGHSLGRTTFVIEET